MLILITSNPRKEILAQTNDNMENNNNIIQLTVKKVDGDWRWLMDNSTENTIINPTLEFSSNTPVDIEIQGTGGNHNFIIETLDGNQLLETEEFGSNAIDFAFTPDDLANTTLVYYCEPHADTMKGTIEIK